MSTPDDGAQTTARPVLSLVPSQPRLIRAGLILADFALELRAAGRRCEMAEKVLEETPEGQTKSGTWTLLTERLFQEALKTFDSLANEYIDAKMDSVQQERKIAR